MICAIGLWPYGRQSNKRYGLLCCKNISKWHVRMEMGNRKGLVGKHTRCEGRKNPWKTKQLKYLLAYFSHSLSDAFSFYQHVIISMLSPTLLLFSHSSGKWDRKRATNMKCVGENEQTSFIHQFVEIGPEQSVCECVSVTVVTQFRLWKIPWYCLKNSIVHKSKWVQPYLATSW